MYEACPTSTPFFVTGNPHGGIYSLDFSVVRENPPNASIEGIVRRVLPGILDWIGLNPLLFGSARVVYYVYYFQVKNIL